ncbi:MAG: DUF1816 domain-containing protein [Cyanobacteria bacterium J06635_15]
MKSLFDKPKRPFVNAWWVEIVTDAPQCLYYFGPFENEAQAAQAQTGYGGNLEQDAAELLRISVMQCPKPSQMIVEYPYPAHVK